MLLFLQAESVQVCGGLHGCLQEGICLSGDTVDCPQWLGGGKGGRHGVFRLLSGGGGPACGLQGVPGIHAGLGAGLQDKGGYSGCQEEGIRRGNGTRILHRHGAWLLEIQGLQGGYRPGVGKPSLLRHLLQDCGGGGIHHEAGKAGKAGSHHLLLPVPDSQGTAVL